MFIGLAGSGKSTWARRLAARLNLPYADLDVLAEAALGATIPEIFAAGRQSEFRACETRLLRALLGSDTPGVVATGGGAPLARTVDWGGSYVVWLDPPVDVLERRLAAEWQQRPLFAAAGAHGWPLVLRRQASERRTRYEELAVETWSFEKEVEGFAAMERLALGWSDGTLTQDR